MKNFLAKILLGTAAVACAFSLTACTDNNGNNNSGNTGNNNSNNTGNTATVAQQQLTRAKQTYNSFYNKEGLFSEQAAKSKKAAEAAVTADAAEFPTFDDVRETLNNYNITKTSTKNIVNSYVADIFSYSQVQTSIIDAYGEQALTDVYSLTYESVDWDSDTTNNASWIYSTKLLSAAFAGTDLENGRVYCTQAHISMNKLVLANLEYYYNSDSDMGVTTINWHSDGSFEYHYCSAGSYEILQAFGSYDDSGKITLSSFTYLQKDGVLRSSSISSEVNQYVFDYVQSEVSRINGKVEGLQEQNGREREVDGIEGEEEEHVGVCSVKMDFSILSKMLIK